MNLNRVLVFCALLIASCNTPDTKTDNSQTSTGFGQNGKFIAIPDAEEFLPGWSTQNQLIYHTIAEPDNLHPTNGTSAMRNEIFQFVHCTLLHLDYRTLEITTGLLKELPVSLSDGISYECILRNEPRWDDGSPITAEDVIFTAKANKCRYTDNPHAKPYWDNLRTIDPDPVDPMKFTVRMKTPYMHNIIFWGDWPIIQQAFYDPQNMLTNISLENIADDQSDQLTDQALKDWAATFNDAANGRETSRISGAGMYHVSDWDPGISVTLSRKSNHWSANSTSIYETAYPEKIIYRVNKDPNSQMLDFKAQVFDGSIYMSTKSLLELQADSNFSNNYHSRFTDSFNYTYIGMNMRPDGNYRKKIFDDQKVRKAMAYLTPVDDMNEVINKAMNKRMVGPVSYLKADFDSTLKAIPYDPVKAASLLDEAGWRDSDGDNIRDKVVDGEKIPFRFQINYMTNTPDWKDYATMCKEAYEKVGIMVDLNPLDFSIFVANARKHDFDMMIGVWGQSAFPEDFTQLWHTESWLTEGTNYPGFGTASTDALIDSIKLITDPVIRAPLVKRFQNIVYDEQPMIFLFSSLRKNIIHKRFGNVEMYFERPGILLNNLELISLKNGVTP